MGNNKSKSSTGGWSTDQDLQKAEAELQLKALLKFQSHEFLVFGYVRTEIEPEIDSFWSSMGIPHVLLQLIISYYNVGINGHMLLWVGSEERTDHSYNQVHILNIKNRKKYKLSIYSLNDNLFKPTKTNYFDRLNASYCSMSSTPLPQWILKMKSSKQHVSQHKKYHLSFRFGGTLKYNDNDPFYKDRCDLLMIDSTKLNAISDRCTIDAYYCNIPTSLSGKYEYIDYSLIFNNNYLIMCGGFEFDNNNHQSFQNKIKRFDLQTLIWDDDKFIRRSMNHPKSGTSVCIINDKNGNTAADSCKLITIGGTNSINNQLKSVEMYSFNDNNSQLLKPMNIGRYKAGCKYLDYKQQIVVIGGLGKASNTIELYDIHKNIWMKVKKKSIYRHVQRPLIWNDEMNYNILYIAGGNLYNGKRKQLGYFECMDMRDPNGKTWTSFGVHNLLSTLELRNSGDVFNDWTLRAGLVI